MHAGTVVGVALAALAVLGTTAAADFPEFKVEEIDAGLKIGYAVITADIDGDGRPDIVVVDQHKVVWYRNPTWKKRVILDGKTKPDNVCIAALDVDGDKKPEFVLGAGWKPFDTTNPGTLQWLRRGATLDDEWTLHPIPCDQPTIHRVQVADLHGDGRPEVIAVPLMGLGATAAKKYLDGRPVVPLAYTIPTKEPEKERNWKARPLVADGTDLRVVHNFHVEQKPLVYQPLLSEPKLEYRRVHLASSRGVLQSWQFADSKWNKLIPISTAHNQELSDNRSPQAASAVGTGFTDTADTASGFIATVEPWHGNTLVVYPQNTVPKWIVLDDHLRWGHALRTARLTDDKTDFIILGVRDNPDPKQGDTFTEKRGIRLYRYDPRAKSWARSILEDGGVAVEDLTVTDLDGDGRPDIVAVGRATGNCRIYWNRGVK